MSGKYPSNPVEPWLIVIATSAGGIQALQQLLAALRPDLPASIVIVQHRPAAHVSFLEAILGRSAHWPVETAREDVRIAPHMIYVARPDLHLTIGPTRRFSYVDGTRVRGVLSSANPLFASAASAFRDRVVAVVLTGSGMDATDGVQAVKAHGGIVIAQDQSTAEHFGMPQSAIKSGAVDYVLPIGTIAPMLAAIVEGHAIHETSAG
jgi:two-component system chemotaxis response regulator CheB